MSNVFGKSVVFLIAFSVLLSACHEMKYKNFFSQPLDRQHKEFKSFSIEKQFDIYIYAVIKRHPPDISFAHDMIKSKGDELVPFLMEKLKTTNNEFEQEKIIYVFKTMVSVYGYELSNNKELIVLLEDVVSSMQFNAESNTMLQVIKGEQGLLVQ